MIVAPKFLHRPNKPALAYRSVEGAAPGILWLGGYASDMLGTKAQFLHDWAMREGRAYTRFDYAGHGESEGDFEQGCISDWADDALAVLEQCTKGPQILIGSSMGAWVTCLLAQKRPDLLAGIIFIAPAPDFTTELMPKQWPQENFTVVERDGRIEIPSAFDDSVMVYTKKLFDDGKTCSVLNQPLAVTCPVHILHGLKDDVVPWQHAMRLADHIQAPSVSIRMEKDSDHRFSGDRDLHLLAETLNRF